MSWFKKKEVFKISDFVMPRTFIAEEGGRVYNLQLCRHMWSIWSEPYRYGNGFHQARECKICKLTESVELKGISEDGAKAISKIPFDGAVFHDREAKP